MLSWACVVGLSYREEENICYVIDMEHEPDFENAFDIFEFFLFLLRLHP